MIVAGVMRNEGLFPFQYNGQTTIDANTIDKDGASYYAVKGSSNTDGMIGAILSFKADLAQIQFFENAANGKLYFRTKHVSGSGWVWTNWKEI